MNEPRIRRLQPVLSCLVGAVIALTPRLPAAQAQEDDPIAHAIAAQLDASMHADASIRGARLALQPQVHKFYARRAFRPAWSSAHNASQLHRALADSYEDGLDPADYHLPLLEEMAAQLSHATATEVLRAQYDVLLTEALLRLAYHLSFGKVDPETFDAQWNYARTAPRDDIAERVEQALASEDIYQRVEALKPSHPLYVGLKWELKRYRAADAASRTPIATGPTLKPGMKDERAPLLRARLIASGDLGDAAYSDSLEYDAPLAEAVRLFQTRTGLESDGAVGASTIAELNTPAARRIQQLRVNLDRARVVLQDLPEEFVVVNIAGYMVYFVRGRQIVWSSRAQVGKPYRRTPVFRSDISFIVLNPTWTVPPGIIANDILPAARRDPGSITRKGLRVLDAAGREIDPETIDWGRFKSGHIPYTLRQDPGPSNALGRVKLMFPNPHLVYLHDTPSQELFDRAERTFSSGCVRVERALELAELVLHDPARWTRDSLLRALDGGATQNITLTKRIPVLLMYWTAWVDPAGRVNFRHDVYDQDAQWAQALDAEFKLRAKPLFSAADPAD